MLRPSKQWSLCGFNPERIQTQRVVLAVTLYFELSLFVCRLVWEQKVFLWNLGTLSVIFCGEWFTLEVFFGKRLC